MEAIELALWICMIAHNAVGQKRKYTEEPYWLHPVGVRYLLDACCKDTVTDNMRIAALLHDVLEDTHITEVWLRYSTWLPIEAIELVVELTDTTTLDMGNRSLRKALERKRLSSCSREAKTIKLADLIDNCRSICKHDPKFGKVFLEEFRLLLNEALYEGDEGMYKEAYRTYEYWSKELALQ